LNITHVKTKKSCSADCALGTAKLALRVLHLEGHIQSKDPRFHRTCTN